jgi:RHS repeat-associated protein
MKTLTAVLATVALSAGVASAQQEVVEYYHLDAIGNVRAVSNQANVVTERHDYLPFGEECTTGPCTNNPGAGAGQPRKFTSKERDQETGLDYFGARYYGARIARFTTVDPIYTWRENLVDPQRWNRYAYALNNPVRYVDPDGRQTLAATMELGRTFQRSGHPWLVAAGGALIFVAANSDKIPPLGPTVKAAEEEGIPAIVSVGGEQYVIYLSGDQSRADAARKDASPLPGRDETGKVHGDLPERKDLSKYSPDELRQFQGELKGSVERRIRRTAELGPEKKHGERQAAEQQLIKQIDEHLKDGPK